MDKTEEKYSEVLIRNDEFWKELFQKNKLPDKQIAIILYHGVGNQLPLATLDDFTRNLAETIEEFCNVKTFLEHKILSYKSANNGTETFYDCIRIITGKNSFIDVYEYYWAYETQDKANVGEIQKWVSDVVKGATEFYKITATYGEKYKDSSFLFSSDGKLKVFVYRSFLNLVFLIIPLTLGTVKFILDWASRIPILGYLFTKINDVFNSFFANAIANIAGDVTIYNSFDPKSKFFLIRKKILENSLNFVLEVNENDIYDKLILAGHSLGSEIAYDTINRFSYLGQTIKKNDKQFQKLLSVLKGFVTFGSPLDKIAFFIQQKVKKENYLWSQMLSNYRCFRLQKLSTYPKIKLHSETSDDFLSQVVWRNYHDEKDYVSGSLDYYNSLTNIKCLFPNGIFTHSNYWSDKYFYSDLLKNYCL